MMENKKALSAGQAESAEECAGARIEGKEYQNLSPTVYHKKSDLSTLKNELIIFGGYLTQKCAWCGKEFVPTKPEYAWGKCCSYTCCLRYDESKAPTKKERGVVALGPDTKEEIRRFNSVKEAADFCGGELGNIRNALNGIYTKSNGYAWRWEDEPARITEPKPEPTKWVSVSVRLTEQTYNKLADHVYGNGSNITNFLRELIDKELSKKRSVMEYENH